MDNIEIKEVTTSGTAQQIIFTNLIREIMVYNRSVSTSEIVKIYDTEDGTKGYPIYPSANPVLIPLAGNGSMNVWLKSESGTPKITILGVT